MAAFSPAQPWRAETRLFPDKAAAAGLHHYHIIQRSAGSDTSHHPLQLSTK